MRESIKITILFFCFCLSKTAVMSSLVVTDKTLEEKTAQSSENEEVYGFNIDHIDGNNCLQIRKNTVLEGQEERKLLISGEGQISVKSGSCLTIKDYQINLVNSPENPYPIICENGAKLCLENVTILLYCSSWLIEQGQITFAKDCAIINAMNFGKIAPLPALVKTTLQKNQQAVPRLSILTENCLRFSGPSNLKLEEVEFLYSHPTLDLQKSGLVLENVSIGSALQNHTLNIKNGSLHLLGFTNLLTSIKIKKSDIFTEPCSFFLGKKGHELSVEKCKICTKYGNKVNIDHFRKHFNSPNNLNNPTVIEWQTTSCQTTRKPKKDKR